MRFSQTFDRWDAQKASHVVAVLAAIMLVFALASASSCTSVAVKPKTPTQFFIVAVHDYTLLAQGVEVYIDGVTVGLGVGQEWAFKQTAVAELLGALVGEGRIVIDSFQSQLLRCTGKTPREIGGGAILLLASAAGLDACSNMNAAISIALGDLRGVSSRLKPRLAAARGEI